MVPVWSLDSQENPCGGREREDQDNPPVYLLIFLNCLTRQNPVRPECVLIGWMLAVGELLCKHRQNIASLKVLSRSSLTQW